MDVARHNSWHQQPAMRAATSPPFFGFGANAGLNRLFSHRTWHWQGVSLSEALKWKLNGGEKFFATVGGDRLSRAEFDRMAGCLNHWMDVS